MAKVKSIIYNYKNRDKFIDVVIELRNKSLTYKQVAAKMNKDGFRNRNNAKLTNPFIGNILNRWVSY